MQVIHFESRQSFAHFVTSYVLLLLLLHSLTLDVDFLSRTAVIIGGVLTVASLLDALFFRTGNLIKKGQDAVAAEAAGSGGRGSYAQASVVKLL